MGGGKYLLYRWLYNRMSYKCGFSIGADSCGYGLVLHHYGNVIVGTNNTIGNFANLLPSCISKSGSVFGDYLFMGYGAIVTSQVVMGDNVKIAANSVVNCKSKCEDVVLAGAPAIAKKNDKATWVEMYSGKDGEWINRLKKVEDLKIQMGL